MVLFFYFFNSIPLPESIGSRPTEILDSTGREFATLQPEYQREDIALDALPPHVTQAVLAAEDANFYTHRGVSLPGIFRAALSNVVRGEISQGGSTISQQYVKTVTADDERTALRKVREAALAVKLEQRYSKDEILGFYLNTIYFGRGAYGIQAAARAYFGKDAAELDVGEAAMIAGIIPAPSRYDPRDNPEAAQSRYRYVLDRMVDDDLLDPVDAGRLRAMPPQTVAREAVRFNEAPFFVDLVRRELEEKLGDQLYTGLRVTTTLNMGVQSHARQAYTAAFAGIEPHGALVALDPGTGGVLALVGGKNYATDQVNLALAQRQPGSTFKPFTLAAWIEQGKSPESYFDAPAEITLPEADNGADWEVHNYEGASYEPMSLREATHRSVNTVYAQVQTEVGAQATAALASRAVGRELPAHSSLVLGTTEVSPLELAEAYNTFAAGGVHREPFTVREVRNAAGEVRYTHETTENRAFSEQVAHGVTDVLQGVVNRGTGAAAAIGRPSAGKTGTTQDYGDAWFAGYVPQLTAVVWMGNRDDRQTMAGEPTGGGLPAETWRDFMAATLEGVDVAAFPPPSMSDLIVTRASPTPTPTETATELQCAEGEVAVTATSPETTSETASEPAQVCVATTPTASASPSASPTVSASPSETASQAPSEQPEPTPSPEPSESPTGEEPEVPPPTVTASPTAAPTPAPTATKTLEPTAEPTEPAGGEGIRDVIPAPGGLPGRVPGG